MASRIVFETPSASEGRTKQSRPCSRAGTSARSPGSHARSRTPASARMASTRGRNRPSPTRTSRIRRRHSGSRCTARTNAWARLTWSLTVSIRPTVPTSQWSASLNGQPSIGALPACGGRKRDGIDAVVDLYDPLRRETYLFAQVDLEVRGQRDIRRHEGAERAPHPLVPDTRAVQIVDIASMLPVNACRHGGRPRRQRRLQRGNVARVHDRGSQLAKQPKQRWVQPKRVPGTFVQRDVADVLACDPRREAGIDLGQRQDGMPPFLRRQPIDEIHDAVLEPPDLEPVDDVHDQRRGHRVAFTVRAMPPAPARWTATSRMQTRAAPFAQRGPAPVSACT